MAMAYRAHYAFGARPLTTKAGLPTSAVFGSATFLARLIQDRKPDYLVIACDARERTFRHEMYERYKANRAEMPEEMAAQLPHLFRLFEAMGIKMLRQGGVEADDLIGTLACKYARQGLDVYIVSGDKDFMQLVGDHVYLLQPKKGEEAVVVDRAGVTERFGVAPEQVIDCLAIIGDTSDNVPGVHGIGDKGAAKLIADYGSLDAIYANLDAISNKRARTALETSRESAYLSKKLVTIKTDVALDFDDLEELACDREECCANERLLTLFRELEFKGLAQKVEQELASRFVDDTPLFGRKAPQASGPRAELTSSSRYQPGDATYRLVTSRADLQAMLDAVARAPVLAVDTETTGLDAIGDEPIGASLSAERGKAFYLPLHERHLRGDLPPGEALAALRSVLSDAGKTKVGHNLKFDLHMLTGVGAPVAGRLADTMIMDWLIDPGLRAHGLDPCTLRYFNYVKIPTSSLMGPKMQTPMLEAPLAELAVYACEDADFTLRLYEHLSPKIDEHGLRRVLDEAEMPLLPILMDMERAGVHVDKDVLGRFSGQLEETIAKLTKEIHALAGTEFNIGSPKQLGDVLFNQLKIHEQLKVKYLKKTQSGFSTDESVLQRLAAHPLPRAILEYREVTKLKGTYVDALPSLVHRDTGRVHTTFHQTGTATGRLSSSDPNLQNIPIRTELGREIRKAFTPADPGRVLISADYSQVELRLLAHLAEEDALAAAFRAGEDIHRATAARIFGVDPGAVTSELRSRAKAINFGIIYGMGPRRLAAETGVTMAEATQFIDRYFAGYPGIRRYVERAVAVARDTGESRTIMGRRRVIDGLDPATATGRDAAASQNIAVNTPIQGSAADLVKLAMITVGKELRDGGFATRMLLQVHDELVLEGPQAEAVEAARLVEKAMSEALQLSVPLKVDTGVGSSWLEAH